MHRICFRCWIIKLKKPSSKSKIASAQWITLKSPLPKKLDRLKRLQPKSKWPAVETVKATTRVDPSKGPRRSLKTARAWPFSAKNQMKINNWPPMLELLLTTLKKLKIKCKSWVEVLGPPKTGTMPISLFLSRTSSSNTKIPSTAVKLTSMKTNIPTKRTNSPENKLKKPW